MSLLNRTNRELRSESSRLRNRLDQVIGLESGRVVQGTVERIYTTRGKIRGTFFDFSKKAKRKVRHLRDSVWILR